MEDFQKIEEKKKASIFPAPYLQPHEWGWSKTEADEFFTYFNEYLYCDREILYKDKNTGLMLPTGNILNRKSVAYAVDPNHSQVRGTADSQFKVIDEDHCAGTVLTFKDAPEVVLNLRKKLTAYLRTLPGYETRTVNYMAVIKYPDHTAQINWHKHNEDNGIDTPTFIVSTGEERPFHLGLRKGSKKGKGPGEQWSRIAQHGSLIVMPASYNDTHLHAILPESESCGPRISVATKCLVKPRVFSLKAGWGHYPVFAQYVGCKFAQLPGTIYGNSYRPFDLDGHSKSPIATAKEPEKFREYAEKKWLDPGFRAQAIKDLRGKHLLCWCPQDKNPDSTFKQPFCHARIWLEIVNRPEGK